MMRRTALCAVALLAATSGTGATAGQSNLPAAASSGEIVFVSDRATANDGEVYSLAVGSRPHDVSRSAYADFLVAAAPRGGLVAFWSSRDGAPRVFLARADGTGLREVPGTVDRSGQYPPGGAPVFSPDGSLLAVSRWGGASSPTPVSELLMVDVRRARARLFATHCGLGGVAFSPDGRLLACGGGGTPHDRRVSVYDLQGRLRFSVAGETPLWSSQGLLSVSTVQPATTRIVDAEGRAVARLAGQVRAWSPDGRLVALAAGDRLVLAEPSDPSAARVVAAHAHWTPYGVAFAPDGAALGFESYTGPIVRPVIGGVAHKLPSGLGVWSADGRYAFTRPPRTFAPGAEIAVLVGDRLGRHARVVGRFPFDDHGASRLVWLPSGRRLLYETSAPGNGDLYAVHADGSGLQRLTHTALSEETPAWSPDGTRLAYASTAQAGSMCPGCPITLRVANAAAPTASATQITTGGSGSFDSSPNWSPDGRRLVFVHATYDSSELDVVNADGSGRATLVPSGGQDPAWSPDGTTIAYIGNDGIDAVDPAGTAERLLRAFPPNARPASLAWSPDARLLAYTLASTRANKLYVVDADGSGRPRLVTALRPAARLDHPSFSPAGDQIAFAAHLRTNRPGTQTAIYVVDLDGTNLHAVATSLYHDETPSWQPTPHAR